MNQTPCPNCGWVHPTAVEIAATKRQRLVQIIEHVAIAFGLSVGELRGPRRMMHIVEARHLVFAVARHETKLALEEIGQALNRDHTTVIFGISATAKRAARRPCRSGSVTCRRRSRTSPNPSRRSRKA